MLVKYRSPDPRLSSLFPDMPYRWWTPDMESSGRYHEAASVAEIQQAAGPEAQLQDVTDHV